MDFLKNFGKGFQISNFSVHSLQSVNFTIDGHASEAYLKPSETSTMKLFCENS